MEKYINNVFPKKITAVHNLKVIELKTMETHVSEVQGVFQTYHVNLHIKITIKLTFIVLSKR